jgi:hypothetical protein
LPGRAHEFWIADHAQYGIWLTLLLPRPVPFRTDECMPKGITWPRRLRHQIFPKPPNDCCWYHSVDWRKAAPEAVRIAHEIGVWRTMDVDDMYEAAESLVRASGLPEPEASGAWSLLEPGEGIQASIRPGGDWGLFINGQHRTQAMLEAGVRCTVILRWMH